MNTTLTWITDLILGPRPVVPPPAGPPVWPGLLVGWRHHTPVYAGPQHAALVLGPPRSGKTSGIVAPNLAAHPGPAVATSTKADLLMSTLPWRTERGVCWYFDPSGTTTPPPGLRPLRWSPLAGCDHWDTAVARAHALVGTSATHPADSHWAERAETLLAPLLFAAAVHGLVFAWVIRWVLRRDIPEPLRILAGLDPACEMAIETLTGIAETDERERSGIFSTAARVLTAYRMTTALALTSEPNFDPERFVTSGDTVYLVAPANLQAQLAPIVVALLDTIRHHTYTRPFTGPPVLWALDEVANIAPLPDLPSIISEGGSQGLITLACLQDLTQARARWGPAADGFLTLFAAKIALGGIAEPNTLRTLSYLAGNHDIAYTSAGTSRTGWTRTQTTNTNWQQRPRLPPETINQLPPGVALLAHTHRGVTHVTLRPTPPPRPRTRAERRQRRQQQQLAQRPQS